MSEENKEVEESEKEGQRERLLCEVPDERLAELHAKGLSDKAIMMTLKEEGISAYQSGVSRRLRKQGLAPQRKTADERKEEVAALLEQDKSVAEIAAATGLSESSVKLYCSILKVRPKEAQGLDDALPEPQDDAEADENWDQGPFYRKPEEAAASATGISKRREPGDEDEIDAKIRELHALKLTDKQIAQKIGKSKCGICQRRNRMGLPTNEKKGRPPGVRRSGMAAEEGEYPIIGGTKENPVYGSMRMKVVEEKAVDGHKVRVLPPGYTMGAEPAKNVAVRS